MKFRYYECPMLYNVLPMFQNECVLMFLHRNAMIKRFICWIKSVMTSKRV